MRRLSLHHAKPRRRFVRTSDSGQDRPAFPNLCRKVIPDRPDTVCRARDLQADDTRGTPGALRSAVASRRPPRPSRIHHAGPGRRYAIDDDRKEVKKVGLIGSMSSRANLHHNAQAESFTKPLKVEDVHLTGDETFDDVATRLPRFIADVYDARRLYTALGCRSPEESGTQRAQQAA